MSVENLKQLEARLDEFLRRHERVCKEQETLASRLREQEKELAAVAERVRQYEAERVEVRTRLERLLARLNGLDLV